jgi:hypothetical protein
MNATTEVRSRLAPDAARRLGQMTSEHKAEAARQNARRPRTRRPLSDEARQRIAEGQQRKWAERRGETAAEGGSPA